ncbi:hypothetical protein ACTJJ0_06300 [Chitinophaga sp. 22321]|uniref:Alpha-L-rhamnosidase six-hairpin glycosidase domain-containing protein n=1 Tax=Chitinophaga hostae TaxID=2831022 RepID=A0ABS5IYU1_9BACT|nr:hypothetical protein [Chitinophaga hostae]MBS0028130.1 hypothetical protein [Chitinophaga hostae]
MTEQLRAELQEQEKEKQSSTLFELFNNRLILFARNMLPARGKTIQRYNNMNTIKVLFSAVCWFGMSFYATAQSPRWAMATDGGIRWTVQGGSPHTDHIEMSGKQLSGIITYGVNAAQELLLKKQLVFPMLRTIPNNTHASLKTDFDGTELPSIMADGIALKTVPANFYLKGFLRIHSRSNTPITVTDILFPSVDKAGFIQTRELVNNGSRTCRIRIDSLVVERHTAADKGVYGEYIIRSEVTGYGSFELAPGQKHTLGIIYTARKISTPAYYFSPAYELTRRVAFVKELMQDLVLETPNDTINRGFAFAKVRAAESIYDTKAGLMHGPGGGAYYAAIWANDQAEYVNPFFPFLGNAAGNESAINSFRLFAGYMNAAYKPIPSSIIAEGDGYWNGAGDRGDQAMIAYGAARFALASGDTATARQLYPLINWCLQYLELHKRPDGIINSDADELEGRFPAGKANLSTNALAYGAYQGAAFLATALGDKDTAALYNRRAKQLGADIERFFGHTVQGFDTYRYYEENTVLRSWICLPLVMGINERRDATMKALLSPYLWTQNGILTAAGDHTFWDRSTLYAFRGLFFAGATDTTLKYLAYYTGQRLLGEHVPYPVEAWPEGGERHLSAESGLYCRVITEGLFGMAPTGLRSFEMCPRLPATWNQMALRHIRAFGADMDIAVKRVGKQLKVTVTDKGKVVTAQNWNGKETIRVQLL